MNEATKQEPGAVEALLLPFKDSHSLAFTLLPKARTIDQQIADLTRERDAAREALKAWIDYWGDVEGSGSDQSNIFQQLLANTRTALREQPTDTAEGGVDAGS
jgi:hypothetical protein